MNFIVAISTHTFFIQLSFFYRAGSCTTDMWIYYKLEWKNMSLNRFMICAMLYLIPTLFKELTYCYLWLNLTLIKDFESGFHLWTQKQTAVHGRTLSPPMSSFFSNVLELLKLHTGCSVECIYFYKRFSFFVCFRWPPSFPNFSTGKLS